MKMKKIVFGILFGLGLLLGSCQKEESKFIDNTKQEGSITSASPLTQLLKGISQHPGSKDNLLDESDCTTIVFPVTVIANNQTITLTEEADINLVQAIFDESQNDENEVAFIYPIQVVLQDFATVTVEDEDALQELTDSCEDYDDIACVEFIYPISLFTYNTNNEQTGMLVINTDKELYLLFSGIEDDDLISIEYPVSVVMENGTQTAHSNDELETLLDAYECNDGGSDDDNPDGDTFGIKL